VNNFRQPIAGFKKIGLKRKPGYFEACLAAGTVVGDELELTPEAFAAIRQEFDPGLGDRIHALFGPIGQAIGWPCLKGDGTTDLKPDSLCAKIREKLNGETS
jgi:hypothetical protein